jgi:diacylglycerol kinase family enzyme
VTVSNSPYHGLGFAISPTADPTDGQLDVVVFRGMSRFEVLRHFLAVARRRPRRDPRICGRSRQESDDRGNATIASSPRGRRRASGRTPVTLEVRPAALRLLPA